MIPSDRFLDYSFDENQEMGKKAEEFLHSFKESSEKLTSRKNSKLKMVAGELPDNSIWINPSITVDFQRLKTTVMPLNQIFDRYDIWFDELFRLVIINEPRLHRPRIAKHIIEIMMVCSSFQEILQIGTHGLPIPPPQV